VKTFALGIKVVDGGDSYTRAANSPRLSNPGSMFGRNGVHIFADELMSAPSSCSVWCAIFPAQALAALPKVKSGD
jgi:hypothetical protein